MQFAFFYWKTIDIVENLEMKQIAGGLGGIMFFATLFLCVIMTMRTKIDMWFTSKFVEV